ncbi:FecR family protein [Longitalea arenae]|uniref:FecR family protein n=1 Tax=Longitalea arenae TaxID=2812558 RepID=UPI0019680175|nr:FecR family protein [Longitalea arenae]
MNNLPNRIAQLISKYLNDELNDQEKQELDEWVQQSEDHRHFFRQFTDEEAFAATLEEYETSQGIVLSKIKEAITFEDQSRSKARMIWWLNPRKLTAVAASVIIAGGALVWWNVNKKEKQLTEAATVQPAYNGHPASEGAVLKLADGKEIILDSVQNGAVAIQGNAEVMKQGGLLSYNNNKTGNTVLYNTLSTPRGKIYKLLLPDSSKVWLNAASSIRFPTAFTENRRSVEITGEVYFEVAAVRLASGEKMPFEVIADQRAMINVLGTHFNVNAYNNETSLRTTLLEGRVSIQLMQEESGKPVILKPGEQAQINAHTAGIAVHHTNISKVMGWKDGFFSLDDLSLSALMREVERWYDVEVVYEHGIPVKTFFGKVNRDLSLFDFMEGLKDWGVRFRMEGRKVIITGVE